MDSVSIGTSQNVAIKYEVANIGDRFLAVIIDQFVIFGITMGLFYLINILLNLTGSNGTSLYFILILPFFFYHFICEILMDGQSVGKRARKIKVLKRDGSSPSMASYLLRFLLRPIDSLNGLGLLVILINGKGQRLGDIAAGTTVVMVKEKIKLRDLLKFQIDYKPSFNEAINLTDEEIEIIRSVLAKRKFEKSHNSIKVLSIKIKEVLKIESDLPNYEFLDKVLNDYYYLHSGI